MDPIYKLVKRHFTFLVDAFSSVIFVLSVATLIELFNFDKFLSKFNVFGVCFLHLKWTSLFVY